MVVADSPKWCVRSCHGLSIARCLAACVPDSINAPSLPERGSKGRATAAERPRLQRVRQHASHGQCAVSRHRPCGTPQTKSRASAPPCSHPLCTVSDTAPVVGRSLATVQYCTERTVDAPCAARALRAVRALDSTETAVIHPIRPVRDTAVTSERAIGDTRVSAHS